MFQLRDEFNTTKKMSTYLLAFVICDFSVETKRTPTNNINVSVIAAPDKIDQTEFALKAAVELTDYYEKYFGINYPLPKQVFISFSTKYFSKDKIFFDDKIFLRQNILDHHIVTGSDRHP